MTWSSWLNQPTAQIYHASVDYRFPLLGGRRAQDSGRWRALRGKFAQIPSATGSRSAPPGERLRGRQTRCIPA